MISMQLYSRLRSMIRSASEGYNWGFSLHVGSTTGVCRLYHRQHRLLVNLLDLTGKVYNETEWNHITIEEETIYDFLA